MKIGKEAKDDVVKVMVKWEKVQINSLYCIVENCRESNRAQKSIWSRLPQENPIITANWYSRRGQPIL